ncbi:hypothetical protein BBK36DRAFT_23474 [Trichoderma citrinoviride]|uniref:Uncharacterized protein n=1 Tax=Trichoderma citrinoviride TaxID=58853 RepID=A0A2T4B0E5_9HYPO|nr:hypothetical protein BBK36DRAFT_23474 [Trichoderma citrinoviride]PTB62708.1 hypothetical protein BBK36DRAFT_23474 [Trichoderma citrinoviride]
METNWDNSASISSAQAWWLLMVSTGAYRRHNLAGSWSKQKYEVRFRLEIRQSSYPIVRAENAEEFAISDKLHCFEDEVCSEESDVGAAQDCGVWASCEHAPNAASLRASEPPTRQQATQAARQRRPGQARHRLPMVRVGRVRKLLSFDDYKPWLLQSAPVSSREMLSWNWALMFLSHNRNDLYWNLIPNNATVTVGVEFDSRNRYSVSICTNYSGNLKHNVEGHLGRYVASPSRSRDDRPKSNAGSLLLGYFSTWPLIIHLWAAILMSLAIGAANSNFTIHGSPDTTKLRNLAR